MESWSNKTWFITGTSTGFGRAIAQKVLERGGRVVATARDPDALGSLVAGSGGRAIALRLDVTSPEEIKAAIAAAERFGGIDVLVNNAGYGFLGGVEESGDDEIADQFAVNFFGALAVIRAALPAMRARGSGYIVNMSSISGVKGFEGAGFYTASKFALAGMSQSLAGEVGPFGIGVMIVEPGFFRTDFSGRSIAVTRHAHPGYPFLEKRREGARANHGNQPGDPVKGAEAIIAAMDSPNPPRHLALGRDAYLFVSDALSERLAMLEENRAITESTDLSN